MSWPFNTRHLRAELAAVKADRERIRAERTQFGEDRDGYKAAAEKAAALFAEADAANIRLTGRVKALGGQLLAAQVAGGFNPVEARLTAERIARLQRATAAGRAEAGAERARADRLQKRLDDAVGLPAGGALSNAIWQPGYQPPNPGTKAGTS